MIGVSVVGEYRLKPDTESADLVVDLVLGAFADVGYGSDISFSEISRPVMLECGNHRAVT